MRSVSCQSMESDGKSGSGMGSISLYTRAYLGRSQIGFCFDSRE